MMYLKYSPRTLRHALAFPFINSLIIPLLILDIWMEVYHRICFPLCGIPYVRRKNYIKIIDRVKLQYLNPVQKLYCAYCGYANGVIHYWTEIAARTEKYWCGIQHEKDPSFQAPSHHREFTPYGDRGLFSKKYSKN